MKTTPSTFLLAATLCASALVTRPARAQGWGPSVIYHVPIDHVGIYERQREALYPTDESTKSKSSHSVRKTKPKKALVTTTYRESPTVRKRALARFTGWLTTKINGPAADIWRRDFENDMLGRWAKGVASEGLRRGDVADALADYWVVNWQIANGVTSDPTSAQVRAVRHFFASIMVKDPAFVKLSDAQRQEVAENTIYNAAFQSMTFRGIVQSGDQALINRFSDARAASFKRETGFDLRTMKLTNTGFAAKS